MNPRNSNNDSEIKNESEIEIKGYSQKVDISTLKPQLCSEGGHSLEFNSPKREVKCIKCGYGFHFIPNDVVIIGKDVIINSKFIGKSHK